MSVSLTAQRVLTKKAGTLEDVTIEVNDQKRGQVITDLVMGDFIYIGSELPFNSKYFQVSTSNVVTTKPTIEVWNGSDWTQVVDVVDFTDGFKQSGYMRWHSDIDKQDWVCERDSTDVPDLVNTRMFNFYWIRISFDQTLTNTTAINYVGHKFCDDVDLYSSYPDLNNSQFFKAYDSTLVKTTWDEQEITASEILITDLQNRMIISSASQILDWQKFTNFATHKTAEIIFRGLGGSQVDESDRARESYQQIKSLKFHNVDRNNNADLDCGERQITQGYLTR